MEIIEGRLDRLERQRPPAPLSRIVPIRQEGA
jgi:hypothetical protein